MTIYNVPIYREMRLYVSVPILEIYEIESADTEPVSDDGSFGKLIHSDDEALESTDLSVKET